MKFFLCAIARRENLYLAEWIEWHLAAGFDDITVYDNNDADGECVAQVCGRYDGRVRYDLTFRGRAESGGCPVQLEAYNRRYKEVSGAGGDAYILYLDIDEFFTAGGGRSVGEWFLSVFGGRRPQAVRLREESYGAGGETRWRDIPVTERFRRPSPNGGEQLWVKHMYRAGVQGLRMVNVHYTAGRVDTRYSDGRQAEWKQSCTDSRCPWGAAKIRHYVTKSLEEYVFLKQRRCANKTRYTEAFWFRYNICGTGERLAFRSFSASGTMSGGLSEALARASAPWMPEEGEEQSPCTGAGYPEGVSVCISAWKTQDYIEECLDSVAGQTWFKDHDNWEILLGIDACEETLAKVKEIMHKYRKLRVFMMDENVGTYVTCNTIMKQARYSWLLRFDSDDIMHENLVDVAMQRKDEADLVQWRMRNFGEHSCNRAETQVACGVVLIKHNVFEELNGYKDWRCSADDDLIRRVGRLFKTRRLTDILFDRRLHSTSLTVASDTRFQSQTRRKFHNIVNNPANYMSRELCINSEYITTSSHCIIGPDRIVVSLTSWKKRINDCIYVIRQMLSQTVKPDKIILTLSSEEFRRKERDLPADLVAAVNDIFEISWVKKNTGAHKKLTHTLDRFPDDVIISVDDDLDYPQDFIEKLYREFLALGGESPLTCGEYQWDNGVWSHYGAYSLMKKKFVGDFYKDLYDNVVLKYGITRIPFNDPVFTYAVLLNGRRYHRVPYFDMDTVRRESGRDLINPLSRRGTDAYRREMQEEHRLLRAYIQEKYGKTYEDLFDAKVIVNITTWRKRDWCLYEMLSNLKKQTLAPDRIVLWLSKEEYNPADELPATIARCYNEHLLTDIMWVEKNTYCHKRYECFKIFNNCYNVFLDDDLLYRPEFLKELVTAAKGRQDCVSVYATRSRYYVNQEVVIKPITKEPTHYNRFMGGCCCFPPYIMPTDALTENLELRDVFVKKCDESWITPFLIRHDIKVNALYTWSQYYYPLVTGSQDVALKNENFKEDKGIREKERNFFNAVKITRTEDLCKTLWPEIPVNDWKLTLPPAETDDKEIL